MPRRIAWRRLRGSGVLLLGGLCAGTPVAAGPADSLAAMWDELGRCVGKAELPSTAAGSEVTVLFTLTRTGSLQGRPRITHSRLVGSEGGQRAFVGAALAAVSRCLPLDITEGLGGAIAGRPFRFRITSHKPERAA